MFARLLFRSLRARRARLALALVAVLLIAERLSRRIQTSPTARRVHPLLGMLALLIAALQVFFGLALLPL